jgi:cytochrome oxidase Cu insertion factor (SCO1/SenC/PrrC family)
MTMWHFISTHKLIRIAFIASYALLMLIGTIWGVRLIAMHRDQAATVQPAVNAIGGIPMAGHLAPDFHLTDQFGHAVTLSSFHGREVVLAFIDSRCTTLCPLTATIMYNAKARLNPPAIDHISLVAINANPVATSVADVQSWSIKHGMLHQWSFLTGTAKQLQSVYHLYGIYDQASSNGEVAHDPSIMIIDAQGQASLT